MTNHGIPDISGMMKDVDDRKELIYKYVEGRASRKEMELLEQYFKTTHGLAQLDTVIQELSQEFDHPYLKNVSGREEITTPVQTEKQHHIYSLHARSVAAGIAALLLIGVSYFLVLRNSSLRIIHQTAQGEKLIITLPDKTTVTLNGNSSLSYSDRWEKESFRSVTLQGEAFFEVKRNEKKAFIVNTADIAIRVLGTSFNVKSYDEDEAVETTLVEGKVNIHQKNITGNPVVQLMPNQKAIYTKRNSKIKLENIKSENEAAWVKGLLLFEDETFAEIVKDLERWYGVNIIVKDNAALHCRFTTKIEDEPLEDVLKLFLSSGTVSYTVEKNQVVIAGVPCK